MSIEESVTRLREALEAGPIPADWTARGDGWWVRPDGSLTWRNPKPREITIAQSTDLRAILDSRDEALRERDRRCHERADILAKLREFCDDDGDNDWPDNLHLGDALEKHLMRHVWDRMERLERDIETEREVSAWLAGRLIARSFPHDLLRGPCTVEEWLAAAREGVTPKG